jgi:hypothetical protein
LDLGSAWIIIFCLFCFLLHLPPDDGMINKVTTEYEYLFTSSIFYSLDHIAVVLTVICYESVQVYLCMQSQRFSLLSRHPSKWNTVRRFSNRGYAEKPESITQMTGARNNWVLLFRNRGSEYTYCTFMTVTYTIYLPASKPASTVSVFESFSRTRWNSKREKD